MDINLFTYFFTYPRKTLALKTILLWVFINTYSDMVHQTFDLIFFQQIVKTGVEGNIFGHSIGRGFLGF